MKDAEIEDENADWWDKLTTDAEKAEALIEGFGIGSVRPDAATWLRELVEAKRRADVAYEAVMNDGPSKVVNLTRLGDWLAGEDIDPSCLLSDKEA